MFDSAYTSTKYTFVCDPDECDTMIEITTSDKFGFPSGAVQAKCPCGRQMSYISSTIESNPTIERQHMLDNLEASMDLGTPYNANLLVTYKKIENGETSYPTLKVNELEYQLEQARRTTDRLNSLQSKVNRVIDNLTEESWYNPNTEKSEVLYELCDILEHQAVKTIEFSARINVNGSIDVPMEEVEDFDLDSFISEELTIDCYNGNVQIDGYDVDYVSEG